jgi:hypothetical protein
VRDFGDVQPQVTQDYFCIWQDASATQFRTRVAVFFQDKRTRHHLRRDLRQVERGGDSGRPCTYDDNVVMVGVTHDVLF